MAAPRRPVPPPVAAKPKGVRLSSGDEPAATVYRSELAVSLAKAAEIATDVGDAAGTQELKNYTAEIEQSMQRLVQLQHRNNVSSAELAAPLRRTACFLIY